MRRAFLGLWVILPVALSAVFAVLFFPVVNARYERPLAVLFTILGIGVIWASYTVRAYIFTRPGWGKRDV